MTILKVTPIGNVLIEKRCYKSESIDKFISKVVDDGTRVEVYDISDRKMKALLVTELNARKHRMIINNRKYFICAIRVS